MDLLHSYTDKTNFILSIPPISSILQNSDVSRFRIVENRRWNNYSENVESFRHELRQELTDSEINQLKNLRIKIFKGGIIIFLPGQESPIIGYNLKRVF